jgi:hypothetical protein
MDELKLIVAGGRDFDDYDGLSTILNRLADDEFKDNSVSLVSGMAKGADALGYMFAHKNNVKVYEFHADWNRHGKRAGYLRNEEMGQFADALVAFWDGDSKGTKHMIDYMIELGKHVTVIEY